MPLGLRTPRPPENSVLEQVQVTLLNSEQMIKVLPADCGTMTPPFVLPRQAGRRPTDVALGPAGTQCDALARWW